MRHVAVLALVLTLTACSAQAPSPSAAPAATPAPTPAPASGADYRSLQALLDAQMPAIPATAGIWVKHLTTGEEANVNGDDTFNSASVIKIPVAVQALEMVDAGTLTLSDRTTLRADDIRGGSGIFRYHDAGLQPTLRDIILQMIITSDNTATDLMIGKVGGVASVNAWLAKAGYADRMKLVQTTGDLFKKYDGLTPADDRNARTNSDHAFWLGELTPRATGLMLAAIEARTGVTIRFLAAMSRHDDWEWDQDLIARVEQLAACPEIVGVDFMGHETNSTRAFARPIAHVARMACRVRPGFVVQWGISKDPKLNQLWKQMKLADDGVKISNGRGTICFATDGPGTRTTEVYINLADNKRLDARGFSPFGKVTEGMNVVDGFFDAYGEVKPTGGGVDPDKYMAEGDRYIAERYGKLDQIKSAKVIQ